MNWNRFNTVWVSFPKEINGVVVPHSGMKFEVAGQAQRPSRNQVFFLIKLRILNEQGELSWEEEFRIPADKIKDSEVGVSLRAERLFQLVQNVEFRMKKSKRTRRQIQKKYRLIAKISFRGMTKPVEVAKKYLYTKEELESFFLINQVAAVRDVAPV